MSTTQRPPGARTRRELRHILRLGATPEHLALASHTRLGRVEEALAGGPLPPRLHRLMRRSIFGGGNHSVTRRLDAVIAEGHTVDEFFEAAGGLVLPQHLDAPSTCLTRLGAILACRRLFAQRQRPSHDSGLAARAAGAVALYRWGTRIDDRQAVPDPETCRRVLGLAVCSCSPACRAHHSRQAKRSRLTGQGAVPSTAPREHLSHLVESTGAPLTLVAELAGLPCATITNVLSGSSATLARSTSDALLRLDTARLRGAGKAVAAERVYRRLDALLASGWPISTVTAHVCSAAGITSQKLLYHRGKRWFSRPIFEAVDGFYRGHVRQLGPSEVTLQRARRDGKTPWLLWEDIDDLSERPDVAGLASRVDQHGVDAA